MKRCFFLLVCASATLKTMIPPKELAAEKIREKKLLHEQLDNLIERTRNLVGFIEAHSENREKKTLKNTQKHYVTIANATQDLLAELAHTRDHYTNSNYRRAAEFSELIMLLNLHCTQLTKRPPLAEKLYALLPTEIAKHIECLQKAGTNMNQVERWQNIQTTHEKINRTKMMDYIALFLRDIKSAIPRKGLITILEEIDTRIATNLKAITDIEKMTLLDTGEIERWRATYRDEIKRLKEFIQPRNVLLLHRQFLLSRTRDWELYEKNLRNGSQQ